MWQTTRRGTSNRAKQSPGSRLAGSSSDPTPPAHRRHGHMRSGTRGSAWAWFIRAELPRGPGAGQDSRRRSPPAPAPSQYPQATLLYRGHSRFFGEPRDRDVDAKMTFFCVICIARFHHLSRPVGMVPSILTAVRPGDTMSSAETGKGADQGPAPGSRPETGATVRLGLNIGPTWASVPIEKTAGPRL